MRVRFRRDDLVPVLSTISGVVERRQTLPILGNVLIEVAGGQATFTATDLEIEVRSSVKALAGDDGSFTLSARKFADICKALPEGSEIDVKVDSDKALIKSERSKFSVGVLSASDFPCIDVAGMEKGIRISEGILKTVLEKTSFAMAHQDVRYYLNGLLLEIGGGGIRSVATDGHRLATWLESVDFSNIGDAVQVLVPRKAVIEISRLLNFTDKEVSFEVSASFARVHCDGVLFTTKLIDGRFPEYERVIPKALDRRAIIEREAMKRSLGRAAILSSEKYKGIRLAFDKGCLNMKAHNPEKEEAEEEIAIEYEGELVTVGFNVSYLMDVLNVMDTDQVSMEFNDSGSSAVVKEVGKEQGIFVIMPMRL